MKLLSAGSLLLLAALTGCASTQHHGRGTARVTAAGDSTFAVARLYEKQRSFDRAAQAYQDLVVKEPESSEPRHRLGVIAVKQGQLADGIAHLKAAAELAGDNAEVLSDLGYAQYLNGDVEAAVSSYQAALAVEPSNQRATVNLGLALAHMGQDAHALSTLRSVSSSAEAYTSLAYVYSQKGDRQQAEEYFHRAIDEDDGYAPASEALLQLAKAERGQSAGSNRQLPDGITVVSVRPVNESLRAAHYAGHSLSDVASGAVRPAGVFEVALAESAGGTSSGSEDHIARASVPQESVSDSLIKTVSHAEPAKVHAVTDLQRRADGDSPGKAEMDSLLTVLKYGGAEAQVTAIYDLLHLKLIDRRAATALRDLSQSGNLQVREAAKDALQATGLNDE